MNCTQTQAHTYKQTHTTKLCHEKLINLFNNLNQSHTHTPCQTHAIKQMPARQNSLTKSNCINNEKFYERI